MFDNSIAEDIQKLNLDYGDRTRERRSIGMTFNCKPPILGTHLVWEVHTRDSGRDDVASSPALPHTEGWHSARHAAWQIHLGAGTGSDWPKSHTLCRVHIPCSPAPSRSAPHRAHLSPARDIRGSVASTRVTGNSNSDPVNRRTLHTSGAK